MTVLTSGNDTAVIYEKILASLNGGANVSMKGQLLDGGDGIDTITFDDFYPTGNFTLSTTGDGIVTLTTSSGSMTFSNFETMKYANVTINLGTAGNDTITGGSSSDPVLYGLGGDDTIDGGLGSDKMYGGAGNDTYIVNVLTDVVDELAGNGTDTIKTGITYSLADTDGAGANGGNVENLTLTGTAAVNGTGNALNNVLTGNSAANTLTGGDGNDTLNGAGGTDTMIGGLGNDIYMVDVATDVVTELAGQGKDAVKSSVSYVLAANVENLTLTGTAAIDATGNTGKNVLVGNAGANVLTGGRGKDTMTGGKGVDTFNFDSALDSKVGATTRDIVKDFVHATDIIDLSTIDANGAAAGNGTFTLLANLGDTFTGVAGQLRFFSDGGNTVIEGDTNADMVADFQIQLNGAIALTGVDFIL